MKEENLVSKFDEHINLLLLENKTEEAIQLGLASSVSSLINLGRAFAKNNNNSKAIYCYKKALELHPENWAAHNDLVGCYINEENYNLAVYHGLKAVKITENKNFVPIYNSALALSLSGKIKESQEFYKKGKDIVPEHPLLNMNIGTNYLKVGDYENGWKYYEYRFMTDSLSMQMRSRFSSPEWNGQPLDNKRLVVYNEQGIGDVIFFSRFFKYLTGNIIFECQDIATNLIQENFPNIKVISRANNKDCPNQIDCDYHLSICSLPRVLNKDVFVFDKNISVKNKIKIDSQNKKIGICYAGNPGHTRDHTRSFHAKYFQPICNLHGVDVYNLFTGFVTKRLWPNGKVELNSETESMNIKNFNNYIHDIYTLAQVIDQMDVIISVDTAVAHLAAAMGKKTIILLGKEIDWRWHNNPKLLYPNIYIINKNKSWHHSVTECIDII